MGLRVDIRNFRILRNVNFDEADPIKLTIIEGGNEDGKSSFIQAIKFAFIGEAFGHRGAQAANLVTHGEEGGLSVRVRVGDVGAYRTATSGDSLKGVAERLGVDSAVLPLAFDKGLCADTRSKAMGRFLDGSGSDGFNPMTHFAGDVDLAPYLELCAQAGKLTAPAVVAYAKQMRAAQKAPPEPVRPPGLRPAAGDLEELKGAYEEARANLDEAGAALRETRAAGRRLAALLDHYKASDLHRRAVAEDRTDAAAGLRPAWQGVASVNTLTLEATADALERAGSWSGTVDALRRVKEQVDDAVETCKRLLADNPPPPSVPPLPALPEDCRELFEELGGDDATAADLVPLAEAAAEEEAELVELNAHFKREHDRLEADLVELQKRIGAWDAYDAAMPEWEANQAKAKDEWKRWDAVEKLVSRAEADHLTRVGDQFGLLVSQLSGDLLRGRRVRIDRDKGIFLDAAPHDQLSDSTHWRAELALQVAIARRVRSPLLLIDAADILDAANRGKLVGFLVENCVPYFEHVVVAMTMKGRYEDITPPSSSFPTASKWVVRNGEMTRLEPT